MTAREYGEFLKKFQDKYGQATTVFMQVGSFYELYDFQDPETGKTLYNVSEVVDILGLNTSAKTDAQTGKIILTAGIPDYALHRWSSKLTQMGWTVVVVNQNKEASGRVLNRSVSRILSPGTHIETATTNETPSILSILLRTDTNSSVTNYSPPSYGIASLDLTTGQTKSYTASCQGTNDTWTADSLQQFTCIFPPREIIINQWHSHNDNIIKEEQFRKQFSIPYHIPIHIRSLTNEQIHTVKRHLYREEQLRTIYSLKSLLSPSILLGLRSDLEEVAVILLAEYIEEHVSANSRNFHKNDAWHPIHNLICANNALHQLQIVPQQQSQGFAANSVAGLQTTVDSILSLLSSAVTPMGKRAIRDRIVRPLSDANKIIARHDAIETYLGIPDAIMKQIDVYLRFMYDLPRLHRKVQCGTVLKDDIPKLNQSYSAVSSLITILKGIKNIEAEFNQSSWSSFIEMFRTHFPINISIDNENSEITPLLSEEDTTPLHRINYPEIGNLEKSIRETIEKIIETRNTIANVTGVSAETIRIETREKEGFGFKTSTVIMKSIDAKKSIQHPGLTKLHTTHLKSGGWVGCTELSQLNGNLVQLRANLDRICKQYMIKACSVITNMFFPISNNICNDVENWIDNLDCTRCLAITAKEMGWVRPQIDNSQTMNSWVDIEGLRHPIVETARTRLKYVSHNISLGYPGKDNGWLIYGMNASGKSTLMKATGIAVILAQAGSYVPAEKMCLNPFRSIFTRILNHDNIFSGLSSFAVEMSELRDILRVADSNSLVLGDELCAGTESDSAQALVAAGIEWLAKKEAKFLFATHLHDIPKLINLPDLGVAVWHIHVHYEPVTKRLIYDRQLRQGSGSSLYGLEVARAMDLPFEFIETASKHRKKLLGEFRLTESANTSWNTNLVKQACELCGAPGKENSLEVHHIQQRAFADNHGILPNKEHMNHVRNLIVLCDACHERQHASSDSDTNSMENTTISSFQQTSDGPIRINNIVEKLGKNQPDVYKKQSKWSDEELEIIRQTLCKYPKTNLKQLRFILKNESGINISEITLKKYRSSL